MNRNLINSNGISRTLTCVCAVALFVFGLSQAAADDDSLKDGAKKVGHEAGSVAHDIGHGAKKAGKEIAHDAKKAGKAIGQAAKEGGREFRRALKGDKR